MANERTWGRYDQNSPDSEYGSGVGIRGMRERVRQFHGDLVIESNSCGTKVCASLPLKTEESSFGKNNRQQAVAKLNSLSARENGAISA